jgi:hypothetical protein
LIDRLPRRGSTFISGQRPACSSTIETGGGRQLGGLKTFIVAHAFACLSKTG